MSADLRIVLEGKLERVEEATKRWELAAAELRDPEWDRRRGWAVWPSEEEIDAVAALEKKAGPSAVPLAKYRVARSAAEKLLRRRVQAFGGTGAGGVKACVSELQQHLPLRCTHSFAQPVLLGLAIAATVFALLPVPFHPIALLLLMVPLALAILSLHLQQWVTVTQKVLALQGYAVPFQQLERVTLSRARNGYQLIAQSRDGSFRRWCFDHPLTDVVEVLRAQGVATWSCTLQ